MVDPLIPDWSLQIIIASIGATISGIILLITHHSKVNQEIEKHRKIENFERKQKAYREILRLISQVLDYQRFLGSPMTWKIVRYAYDEIMIVGSKEVVEKANELLLNKVDGETANNKIKDLWNLIRKDLYGEELPIEHMHVITPSPETVNALSLYHEHSAALISLGINSLEKASNMDVDIINQHTTIDKEKLYLIKKMAENELQYENDFKKFLEGGNHS